jgi:hypothetical protein
VVIGAPGVVGGEEEKRPPGFKGGFSENARQGTPRVTYSRRNSQDQSITTSESDVRDRIFRVNKNGSID